MASLDNDPHWFAARTPNCHELKARDLLDHYGVEHFIPTHRALVVRCDRKKLIEKSYLGNLIFLRATKELACSLVNYNGLQARFIPDRCSGKTMLVVPDKEMDDFRRVFEYSDGENPLTDETFVLGERIQIIAGDLVGVEGIVTEDSEGTFINVSLCGLLNARAKIPAAFAQKI